MEVTVKLTEPKNDSWNILYYGFSKIQAKDIRPAYILCNHSDIKRIKNCGINRYYDPKNQTYAGTQLIATNLVKQAEVVVIGDDWSK